MRTGKGQLKQHHLTSCGSRRRKVWVQGVPEALFLTFGLCGILVPLPTVSENSLDTNICFVLEKKNETEKFGSI